MHFEEAEARWRALTEGAATEVREWRRQHPKATFREIEAALDERLAWVHARMLEDAAQLSPTAEATAEAGPLPVTCPDCGRPLERRGSHTRQLVTDHDHVIELHRPYAFCPQCQKGFSPPDEELELLPGRLTPRLQEQLVRLRECFLNG